MLKTEGDEAILSLHIRVMPENADEVKDALNEALNTLAREDVIVDDHDDAWEWVDPVTYKVVRMFQDEDKPSVVQVTGLSLAQAQAHCQREDTHGEGWFDGYERET